MHGGAAEEAWQPPSNAHTCSHAKKDLSGAKTTEKVLDHVSDIGRLSHSLAHPASRFLSHSLTPTLSLSFTPFRYLSPSHSLSASGFKYVPVLLKLAKKYFSLPTDECVANVCVYVCVSVGVVATPTHTPLAAGNPHVDRGI